MNASELTELAKLIPLVQTLGIELIEADPGRVQARMPWAPAVCTAGGVLHGGAIMALADTCGGICAYLNLPEGAVGTATIESKTNFLRAVRAGAVTAITRPLHHGRTTLVLETELRRADDRLAAKVTQTQVFNYPG